MGLNLFGPSVGFRETALLLELSQNKVGSRPKNLDWVNP